MNNKYLFVRWKTEVSRARYWAAALQQAWEQLPFQPRSAHLYDLDGTYLIAAEDAHPGIEAGPLTFWDGLRALVFDGVPYLPSQSLARRSWAEDLARLLARHDVEEVHHQLRGAYTLASCSAGSLTAFSDAAGLYPLFYSDGPEYIAVSNRQSMLAGVARATGRGGYDLLALSWLTGQTMICGDRMTHRGVRKCPTGHRIQITPDGSLSLERFETQWWHPAGGEHAALESEDFDRAAAALLENYEAIGDVGPEHLALSLTGGKDSRVNLAAALRSGLIGDVEEVFTNGPPGSPEVECAAVVAQEAGVPHRAFISRAEPQDTEDLWERLRNHVFRYDASACPWDGWTLPAKRLGQVHLSGLGGEHYHKNNKAYRQLTVNDLAHAREIFHNWQQPTDPLGVQHPWVTEKQHRFMDQWVGRRHREGVPLDDLDDVAYAEFRLPMWGGVLTANQSTETRLFPLVHPTVIRTCYRGGVLIRQTQRMHFELIARLAPRLNELPFLGEGWDERLRTVFNAKAPDLEPFRSSRPPSSRNIASWQWQFLTNSEPEIAELLLGSPSSGLFDVYDRAAIERSVCNLERLPTVPAAKSVLSLIAIQLALTGGQVAARDGVLSADAPPELVSNVAGAHIRVAETRSELHLQEAPESMRVAEIPPTTGQRYQAIRAQRRGAQQVVGNVGEELVRIVIDTLKGNSDKLEAKLAGQVPQQRVPLPRKKLIRLRIDPTNRPGPLIFTEPHLHDGDDPRTPLRIDAQDQGWHNRDLQPLSNRDGVWLFTSSGRDPWMVFDCEALLDLRGFSQPFVSFGLIAPSGGRAEVFWDTGGGFSEQQKAMTEATPSVLGELIAALLADIQRRRG